MLSAGVIERARARVGNRARCPKILILVLFLFFSFSYSSLFCPSFALLAEEREELLGEARARLSEQSRSGSLADVKLAPFSLEGGSRLTFISPREWSPLIARLAESLRQTHQQFTALFGEIPPFTSSIRLLDSETFYLSTGAPRWTNAMYYRGEIVIPLTSGEGIDFENLDRSLKHEYTHAVINVLSDGKCPGWLDEGLAQWAEGDENPALQPALHDWLKSQAPVRFSLLQGGFTGLSSQMVPAAYAQSLFAANTAINTFGFERVRQYLDSLRKGEPRERAFKKAFVYDEQDFEMALGNAMKKWSREYARHLRH